MTHLDFLRFRKPRGKNSFSQTSDRVTFLSHLLNFVTCAIAIGFVNNKFRRSVTKQVLQTRKMKNFK